jgi:hypothetical protein
MRPRRSALRSRYSRSTPSRGLGFPGSRRMTAAADAAVAGRLGEHPVSADGPGMATVLPRVPPVTRRSSHRKRGSLPEFDSLAVEGAANPGRGCAASPAAFASVKWHVVRPSEAVQRCARRRLRPGDQQPERPGQGRQWPGPVPVAPGSPCRCGFPRAVLGVRGERVVVRAHGELLVVADRSVPRRPGAIDLRWSCRVPAMTPLCTRRPRPRGLPPAARIYLPYTSRITAMYPARPAAGGPGLTSRDSMPSGIRQAPVPTAGPAAHTPQHDGRPVPASPASDARNLYPRTGALWWCPGGAGRNPPLPTARHQSPSAEVHPRYTTGVYSAWQRTRPPPTQ